MNFSNDGPRIAIVKSSNDIKKKAAPSLSISYDADLPNISYTDYLTLPANYHFQTVPISTKERTTLYITGRNGSGKSYYIRHYITEYIKLKPNAIVRLFSSKNEDENLDDLKFIKRIAMDESIYEDPINYEELAESMVIFDDVDCLPSKIKKAVYHLRDTILKNGRSYKIDCIITNHDSCGKEQKACLGECDLFVFFPMNYNRFLKYFLENYIGLTSKEIDELRKIKTRAVTYVSCTMPNVFITEKEAFTKKYLENPNAYKK